MTAQGREAAEPWLDPAFVRSWAEADGFTDLLDLPRRIAAALVGSDGEPGLVVDVASGTGSFLQVFLEEYPNCRGIWYDASEAMLALAQRNLAPFGDRVEFRVGDMTDLGPAGIPADGADAGADVIVTARAAHHLDRDGLIAFYRDAAGRLAPGGWLINLDHIGPPDEWDRRLRAIRPRFVRRGGDAPPHHHNYPLTSVRDHVDAFAAAGMSDVEIVWRAFYTCLFVGRSAPAGG